MDNIDRMYRHLVRTIRSRFPQYLVQPFDVAELHQTILPYRHHRRELGIETNEDYEITLDGAVVRRPRLPDRRRTNARRVAGGVGVGESGSCGVQAVRDLDGRPVARCVAQSRGGAPRRAVSAANGCRRFRGRGRYGTHHGDSAQ